MFAKVISTLEKNRVSNMKPNSETVPTNVTLISSVHFLGVELTLIRSRIWAAHFAVKCALMTATERSTTLSDGIETPTTAPA